MESSPPCFQMKAIVQRCKLLPVCQRRNWAKLRIKINEASVQQAVDACRGGIGGITWIKICRRTGETETDDVILRLAARKQA